MYIGMFRVVVSYFVLQCGKQLSFHSFTVLNFLLMRSFRVRGQFLFRLNERKQGLGKYIFQLFFLLEALNIRYWEIISFDFSICCWLLICVCVSKWLCRSNTRREIDKQVQKNKKEDNSMHECQECRVVNKNFLFTFDDSL